MGIFSISIKNTQNAGHLKGIPLWLMCFSLGRLLGRLVSMLMYRDVCQANKKILKYTEHRSPRSMRCGTENKVAPRLTCEFALFCFSAASEKAKPPSNVRKNE